MIRRIRTLAVSALVVTAVLAVSACTGSSAATPEPQETANSTSYTSPAETTTLVTDASDRDTSVRTSALLFGGSPVVFLAPSGDEAAQSAAATAAVSLGVPLLVGGVLEPAGATDTATDTPTGSPAPTDEPSSAEEKREQSREANNNLQRQEALGAELSRLGASTVIAVGEVAEVPGHTLTRVEATSAAIDEAVGADIRSLQRGTPVTDTIVLAVDGPQQLAARTTAQAAGLTVVEVPADAPNPQGSSEAITALSGSEATKTVVLGAEFATEEALQWKINSARGGSQLPGGGQLLFPNNRFVAIYGTPGTGSLGVLGEQDATASVARAQDLASEYEQFSDVPVVPMFEIIATVAAGDAGADGNYSNELSIDRLRPWVEQATASGLYVVIDLQPGRTDFLTQAKQYEELLRMPHVGLALDPEWRLKADQVPLKQIGSVSAEEVNAVTEWLATLTRENNLPQKMLVLHQFQTKMLQDRSSIVTDHPELAMLIHVDGQGAQPDKQATWRTLHQDAPDVAWGWKNFYDEDSPTLTPEQTMTEVSPVPDLVTYQ
jgi:hypothetical protein